MAGAVVNGIGIILMVLACLCAVPGARSVTKKGDDAGKAWGIAGVTVFSILGGCLCVGHWYQWHTPTGGWLIAEFILFALSWILLFALWKPN